MQLLMLHQPFYENYTIKLSDFNHYIGLKEE